MRDPARIPIILEKLNAVWQKYPDIRFGQLIINLYSQIPTSSGNIRGSVDFFSIEDPDFERVLDRVLERGFEK